MCTPHKTCKWNVIKKFNIFVTAYKVPTVKCFFFAFCTNNNNTRKRRKIFDFINNIVCTLVPYRVRMKGNKNKSSACARVSSTLASLPIDVCLSVRQTTSESVWMSNGTSCNEGDYDVIVCDTIFTLTTEITKDVT